MRASGGRLRQADLNRIQKSSQQRVEKQVEALIQLIDLPDFDVSEFFQTLLKNPKHDQILARVPREKQIDFFSRNYESFLETQQELLQLKLPELQTIPKAKVFHVAQNKKDIQQQTSQEATVMEIIDAFSSHVLEKNNTQTLRIHQIILEMKNHKKYQQYFNGFYISKVYREYYSAFVQSCDDYKLLLKLGQKLQAARIYLSQRSQAILQQIQTNLNVSPITPTIQKQMLQLINNIQSELKIFKQQFHESIISVPEVQVYVSKWISDLGQSFYQIVEPIIYEKEELSDILEALGSVIQASKEAQSRAISLEREIKSLISNDLPLHMQKVVQVVLQAFEDLLKDDNQLYEFIYFGSIRQFSSQVENLTPIRQQDYGKRCATRKGIFLINSFIIILYPICQEKWQFLHENTLTTLFEKITIVLNQAQLHFWDYYHLFAFLDKLYQGTVKHRKLVRSETQGTVKEKLGKAQKLSQECWTCFEDKIAKSYFNKILSKVPQWMWGWRKYAQSKESLPWSPSSLSIQLIVALQDFFKQIQFRIAKTQFQYLSVKLFQYLLYALEYVLFYSYHQKGTNVKVFIMKKRAQKYFTRAKQFSFEEIETIRDGKVLKMSYFTKYGLRRFAFEIHLVTEVYKHLTKMARHDASDFAHRLPQILVKEHKDMDKFEIDETEFQAPLNKYTQDYKAKPEKFRIYLDKKKGEQDSTQNRNQSQASSSRKD